MESFLDFLNWFFSLKMDNVTLPWAEANKYTIGFILGIPYLIYRWYRNSLYQIRILDDEYDDKETAAEANSKGGKE